MGFPFADVAGTILKPIDTIVQGWQSRKNINLENKLNLEQANLAYKRQIDMFNLANQYNSPAAQMDRFKKAGLNPNLVYGQGSPGNAPNVLPQYRAPAMQANYKPMVSVAGMVQDYISLKQQQEELNIAKANRRVMDATAIIREADAKWAEDNARYKSQNMYNLLGPSALKRFLAISELDSWAEFTGRDSRGINSYQMKEDLKPFFADWIYSRYRKPTTELENYNSMIALRNSQKDLVDLEVQNYLPPWVRALGGAAGGIIGGLSKFLPKKLPPKMVETVTNTSNFGNRLKKTQSFKYE